MREWSLSGISATPNSMHHDLHAAGGTKVVQSLPRGVDTVGSTCLTTRELSPWRVKSLAVQGFEPRTLRI